MDFYGFTLLLRWVLGWFIQPKLSSLPKNTSTAEIAVIIPARNEEKNILNTIAHKGLKIMVINHPAVINQ